MKKFLAVIITFIICSQCSTVMADTPAPVNVYVTISDANGNLVVSHEKISVTDIDNDGVLTINDALYLTHEARYNGGAAAGYGSEETSYGLSMCKLWGVSTYSVGYYLNDEAPMSLAAPVNNGDCLTAFLYRDTTGFSDKYSFFNNKTLNIEEDSPSELILSKVDFDGSYNPVIVPVKNATITIDGAATSYKTDDNGKVSLSVKSGTHIISATSDSEVLVPPVCVVTAAKKAVTKTPVVNSQDNNSNKADKNVIISAADTADKSQSWIYFSALMVSALALSVITAGRRKNYEK